MSAVSGRRLAALLLRASVQTFAAFLFAQSLIATSPAYAVVVRGLVTDALGRPVAGARIQLIQGQKPVAVGVAGPDGASAGDP